MTDDGRFVEAPEPPHEKVRWTWRSAAQAAGSLALFLVLAYAMYFTDVGYWIRCHQSILQWFGLDPMIASCP